MATRPWWLRAGASATVVVLALATACGGDDSSGADGEAPTADAARGAPADGPTADGGWSFTDDRGETVTLDEPPDTIVAQTVVAGGLWEYDVEVAGVFGPLRRPDGSADPGVGLAEPDDFTSVGETEGQPDLEAVAALRPDIIVTSLWGPDSYWGIDDELVDEIEQIAPIVAVRVEQRPMTEPLARYAELAEALGADAGSGPMVEARDAFDTASRRLEDALAAKPGLTVLAASGSPSELYVAWPGGFADLLYFQELGMDLVSPEEHPGGGGYWETLSWEQADTYPADVILADVRGASIDRLLDLAPSTVESLPAVEADQMLAWPASYAMGYGHVASILDDLATAVEQASDDVV